MTRGILLIHRWCGILLCLLVAAWCLSDIVMMYVPYPTFRGEERLPTLQPLSLAGCCRFEALRAELGDEAIDGFAFEMLAGRPVLRIARDFGPELIVDLIDGNRVGPLSSAHAQRVATGYLRESGKGGVPRLLSVLEYDQWTVAGFSDHSPLFKFALDDAAGTEIYVSGQSGDVVQRTTTRARFWNYAGAVTHWLYPAALRRHAAVWSQVVIWTSLAGLLLVALAVLGPAPVGFFTWPATAPTPGHGCRDAAGRTVGLGADRRVAWRAASAREWSRSRCRAALKSTK